MDGRVAQLDVTLRIDAGLTTTSGLAERLKDVARDAVISTYAHRMDLILGDDPHVYVLRDVDCPVSLAVGAGTVDADLAARWGAGLAAGVVKAIERADADRVVFDDQADYVAAFVVDLLSGLAWERWYFGPFHAQRDRPVAEALRNILRENHACLPAIMRSLERRDALERVLEIIGRIDTADLWAEGFLPRSLDDDEGRLFFAAAVGLIDGIALWTGAHPGPEVLRAYLVGRPAAVNWRDPRTLATAVLDAVRFLTWHGHVRPPHGDTAFIRERLTWSLTKLDWLDTTWLNDRLIELIIQGGSEFGGLPTRHTGEGSTPRQRALLDDLVAVVRERVERLDRGDPRAASNAIRLDAWLSSRDSRWGSDPLVAPITEVVLRAWRSATSASSPAALIAHIRGGDISAAVALLPQADRQEAIEAFEALRMLGQPALEVVETLIGLRSSSSTSISTSADVSDLEKSSIATACAGVWLLARAVLDTRLADVLAATTYPSSALSPAERTRATLLALALRWGGSAATTDGRIEFGTAPLRRLGQGRD